MRSSLLGVLSRLLEALESLVLQDDDLVADLVVADLVELLGLLVVHALADEVGRGLWALSELVEQEGCVWVPEEGTEVALAVFVADVANQVEGGVVALLPYLIETALHDFVALVVAVREEKEYDHVYESLLEGGAQVREEPSCNDVREVLPGSVVHHLLAHFHG